MIRHVLVLLIAIVSVAKDVAAQSQGFQDMLLEEIFDVVGTTNKFYVELGFNSDSFEGGSGSNTYSLWKKGWSGLLLDGHFHNPRINLYREFIYSSNVVALFRKYDVPPEPDYVSIDVDSTDVWILQSLLSSYRPRVLTVEYNAHYGGSHALAFPDVAWMPILHEQSRFIGTCYYGSSAKAIQRVAHAHGYKIVAATWGLDLILVRESLWPEPYEIPIETLARPLQIWPEMTHEQAANIVDQRVLSSGGSLCEARASAARALRDIAIAESKTSDACTCAWHAPSTSSCPCNCFRNLIDLRIPTCTASELSSYATTHSVTIGVEGLPVSRRTYEFLPAEGQAAATMRAMSFVKSRDIQTGGSCVEGDTLCLAELIAQYARTEAAEGRSVVVGSSVGSAEVKNVSCTSDHRERDAESNLERTLFKTQLGYVADELDTELTNGKAEFFEYRFSEIQHLDALTSRIRFFFMERNISETPKHCRDNDASSCVESFAGRVARYLQRTGGTTGSTACIISNKGL